MTDERRPVVAGVDTHKDTHYAAVISVTGEHLAAAEFPATQAGYQALQWFITCHGVLVRAGVEGTNSYGAGLSHHLHDAGVQIIEVIRSSRQIQRMRGSPTRSTRTPRRTSPWPPQTPSRPTPAPGTSKRSA